MAARIPFWGPGSLVPLWAVDKSGNPVNQQITAPDFWVYKSWQDVWSPDGAHMALGLADVGQLSALGSGKTRRPDATTCRYLRIQAACAAPLLPYPDAAFARLAQIEQSGLAQGQASPNFADYASGLAMAWRPDGKLLAVMLPGDGFAGGGQTLRISLLDTATGATAGVVTADRQNNADLGTVGTPLFWWSPSGRQLALLDWGSSRIIIWGPGQLPA